MRAFMSRVLGVWLAVAICAGLWPARGDDAPRLAVSCSGLQPGPTRTVARIVDGETLALDDGTELRLIGALAPRAIDAGAEAGAWPLEERSREALGALALGKSIELRFGGERIDRYGRLQAHAFLVDGDQRRWLQGLLLDQGRARAYTLSAHRACSSELLSAERAAREGPRGLWAEAAYQVRSADHPAELERHRGSFQLVEGQIVRVAQARGSIYLNFARSWRQGFSVSLRQEDRHLLGSFAGNPKGLEGRTVRVRGWIEQRAGPVIDLSAGGLIEVLPAPAQPEGR